MELYGLPLTEIVRPLIFNFGTWDYLVELFFGFAVITVALSIIDYLYRRSLWHRGESAVATYTKKECLQELFCILFRESAPGSQLYVRSVKFFLIPALALICVTTLLAFVDVLVYKAFHFFLLKGYLFLVWSTAVDLAALFSLLGLAVIVYIRTVVRPRHQERTWQSTLFLLVAFFMVITFLFVEAMQIALLEYPPFFQWAFFGNLIAKSLHLFSSAQLEGVYPIIVVLFAAFVSCFVLLLFSHNGSAIFYMALNKFMVHLSNDNTTRFYKNLAAEYDRPTGFGLSHVEDFSLAQLRGSDACTQCGNCDDHCPAVIAETPLRPSKVVAALRTTLNNSNKGGDGKVVGISVSEDAINACCQCGVCATVCPAEINPFSSIAGMKKYLILEKGAVPSHSGELFRNCETFQNCYGMPNQFRGDWLQGTTIPRVQENGNFEYLLYVGCSYSFNKKKQAMVQKIAELFIQSGVSIAVLGDEEPCCGDAVLRGGNTPLFEKMAKRNIALFEKYKVKKIITLCPHGYNVLRNEYVALSVHDEEQIEEHIEEHECCGECDTKKSSIGHDTFESFEALEPKTIPKVLLQTTVGKPATSSVASTIKGESPITSQAVESSHIVERDVAVATTTRAVSSTESEKREEFGSAVVTSDLSTTANEKISNQEELEIVDGSDGSIEKQVQPSFTAEIMHYTEIFADLIAQNRLHFKKSIDQRVAIHDSCYLGRANGIYDIHRDILLAVPGVELVELHSAYDLATCCGASGGTTHNKRRIAYKLGEFRAMDAYNSGAKVVAVACPYCRESIAEGVRDINQQTISVLEFAEILIDALESST